MRKNKAGEPDAKQARNRRNKPDPSRPKHIVLTPGDCKPLLHRAENIIDDVCTECGYNSHELKPTHWMYILGRIADEIFSTRPALLRDLSPYSGKYTGNYSLDNIELIYDNVYFPLCYKYNQITSGYSLFYMLGIKDAYLNVKQWDDAGRVTAKNNSLRQKLFHDREISLQNSMLSSNQNPVKFLAIGNHEFGWNEAKRQEIAPAKQVIALDDLPELELRDNSNMPELPDGTEIV